MGIPRLASYLYAEYSVSRSEICCLLGIDVSIQDYTAAIDILSNLGRPSLVVSETGFLAQ